MNYLFIKKKKAHTLYPKESVSLGPLELTSSSSGIGPAHGTRAQRVPENPCLCAQPSGGYSYEQYCPTWCQVHVAATALSSGSRASVA